MSRTAHIWFYTLAALVFYTGCDVATHPESRKTTLFSSLETRRIDPIVIENKMPKLTSQEQATYTTIVDGFAKNADARLAEDEVVRHIERVDQIYIMTGRYLELVKIYEDDYKKRGLKSRVIGRLAFAYVRLDQATAARPLIDEMLAYAPNDPTAHFIDGMYWLRQPRTVENLGRAMEAIETTLRIEPRFTGYEGIDAEQLKSQLDQLRQIVPADWKAQIAAAQEAEGTEPQEKPESIPEGTNNAQTNNGQTNNVEEQPEPTEAPNETEPTEPTEPIDDAKPGISDPSLAVTNRAPQQEEATISIGKEEMYLLLVAEAEIAINEGRAKEAETKFNAAKQLRPDGFEAEFGHLKAGWRVESARNEIARKIRVLAKRELNAQQSYDVGLFVLTNMVDKELTKTLWQRTLDQDPELAKRVDLKTLMTNL